MVLQNDWKFAMLIVRSNPNVLSTSPNGHVVLNQHPIVQHSDTRLVDKVSIFIETRSAEDHIIGLPFARSPAGIYQRNKLLINTCCLTI